MNTFPDHLSLYRLPWSLTDNPIAWLEATATCNIYCQGCYRANVKNGHKSMSEIRADLDVFERYRKFDGISIAGGDPLTHPEIVKIVEEIAKRGHKPILNTNGVALTKTMLQDLKNAGLGGFTFHIDSKQGRPGWKNATEADLNNLRLEFAQRVAQVGGIAVAFNATVYEDTLQYAPEIVEWGRKHIDIVHVIVFIAFRQASENVQNSLNFYVGDRQVRMSDLVYSRPTGSQRLDITSRDVIAEIRKRYPDFAPSAYLNGTESASSLKWLLTTYFGTKEKVYGYAGPHFQEMNQELYHLRNGKYMAYAEPHMLRHGRSIIAAGSLFDSQVRQTFRRYLGDGLTHPWRPLPRLYCQSVMVIQPIDVLADGRMSMCDSCPDMTVYDGELVWSCRLEERIKFGDFATRAIAKEASAETSVPKREDLEPAGRL